MPKVSAVADSPRVAQDPLPGHYLAHLNQFLPVGGYSRRISASPCRGISASPQVSVAVAIAMLSPSRAVQVHAAQ